MTAGLPVILVLTAVALLFVSLLLYLRLGSAGVPLRRVAGLLLELWLTFTAIIGLFAMASSTIGFVPRSRTLDEWHLWWALVRALPTGQQTLLALLLLASLTLLGHLLWTMQRVSAEADRANIPPVGNEDGNS